MSFLFPSKSSLKQISVMFNADTTTIYLNCIDYINNKHVTNNYIQR